MYQKQTSCWDEREYLEYLNHDRHMFAWCLVTLGGVAEPIARSRAEAFYRYESSAAEPLRGLIFHDEAWHWAMLQIFGEQMRARFYSEIAPNPRC